MQAIEAGKIKPSSRIEFIPFPRSGPSKRYIDLCFYDTTFFKACSFCSRTSLRTSENDNHLMTILICSITDRLFTFERLAHFVKRLSRVTSVTIIITFGSLFNEISEFSSSDEIKSSNNHIRLSLNRIKSIGSSIREMLESFSKNKMMELLIDKIHDFNYHLTLRFQNRFQFS